MKVYNYIIIGGGMTGSAAVKAIKNNDPDGKIAMFSEEQYEPYDRPPLSKGLWSGQETAKIFHSIPEKSVDLYLKTTINQIDPEAKKISDDKSQDYTYDKLLIATGGHPIQLPNAPEEVISYRTLDDYKALKELLAPESNVCVIGGGFIGSEIAAALNQNGHHVTMVFPEIGISGLRFPKDLALFLNDYYRENGIQVHNGFLVKSISKENGKYKVTFENADEGAIEEAIFDQVVVGIGIRPNIELAKKANLEVDDGIVVNEHLQTSDPDIFAAGDVAYFINIPLNKRTRVEHEDHAKKSGALAGRNMCGMEEKYDHLPFFYSDLFDLGYEAVGELDKKLEIVSDWIEPFKKGTIFYLDEGKIRGLIFWNLWGKVDEGIKLIKEGKTYQKDELTGLFSE